MEWDKEWIRRPTSPPSMERNKKFIIVFANQNEKLILV